MVAGAAVGVVVHFQIIVGIGQSASVVIPDNHLGILFQVFPQPADAQALVVGGACHAHAAVTGLAAQLRSILAEILGAVGKFHIGHLMQKIAAVEADAHFAVHALAVKAAHPTANQVFAGGGLIVGLVLVGQSCGHRATGPELSVDEHVQPLGQLVDDDAVLVVGRDRFEQAGLDISTDDAVVVVHALDEGPSVLVLTQHVDGGKRSVDAASHPLVDHLFAIGRYAGIDELLLAHIQNRNRPLQQLPASLLVGNVVGEILPEPGDAAFKPFQVAGGQVVHILFSGCQGGKRTKDRCGQQRRQKTPVFHQDPLPAVTARP